VSESSLLYTFTIFKSNRLAILVFITSVNSVLSRVRNGFINKQPVGPRAVFIDTGQGGQRGRQLGPRCAGHAGKRARVCLHRRKERPWGGGSRRRGGPAVSTRRDGRYIHPAMDTLIFLANTSTVEPTVRWMHYKDMQMVHSINRQATERVVSVSSMYCAGVLCLKREISTC